MGFLRRIRTCFVIGASAVVFTLGACGREPKTALTSARPPATSSIDTVQARSILIGRWYGDKLLDDGSRQRWINTRKVDGTYHVQFRVVDEAGDIEEWSENGVWGVRLPIYFTIAQEILQGDERQVSDGTHSVMYDAYEIHALTADSFSYSSFASGNLFTMTKVDDNFEMRSAPPRPLRKSTDPPSLSK